MADSLKLIIASGGKTTGHVFDLANGSFELTIAYVGDAPVQDPLPDPNKIPAIPPSIPPSFPLPLPSDEVQDPLPDPA